MNTIEFGVQSESKIKEEFPHINPRLNTTLLLLNRSSADLIAKFENQVHKTLGLTWAGYRLLFVLWVMGDLEPMRIAEMTKTSRASVSSLSASFEKRGLLKRNPSAADGRSIILSLTKQGIELAKTAFKSQERVQQEVLADLTPVEQEILILLLTKINKTQ